MASATESESDDDSGLVSRSDEDLWGLLPRIFRLDYGRDAGQVPDAGLLAFLFARKEDLRDVMKKYCPGDGLVTAIQAFMILQSRALPRAQRQNKRRGLVDPAWQKVALAKRMSSDSSSVSGSAGSLGSLSWLLKHSGARRQRRAWPTRAAKKLADSELGLTRAAIEKAELERWRGQLVELLLESNVPMTQQAKMASNPSAAIAASLGSMRASTIRKRVREWKKLRAFSLGLSGSPWPAHVGVILDYLQDRLAEPCGHTVPSAILEALAFMERTGGYGAGERLADLQLLKNYVNQATHDLEIGAAPTKKAPLIPLMLVGALELLVVDESAPLFARGYAFNKLLKLWTACRTNDLSGLNPSSLSLTRFGLQGLLERTKTTGPGKRVRHLPIYVSASVGFMASDWLETGMRVWSHEAMSFERDYFLPMPNADWSGTRRAMADYADTVGLSQQLFRNLRLPMKQGSSWHLSDQPLLPLPEVRTFWKEHSERNWLTSLLALCGVSADLRNYVGRWHIASSADEYLRTAKRVIHGMQEQLMNTVCGDDVWDLRNVGLDELHAYLTDREVPTEQADLLCQQLHLGPAWCARAPEPVVEVLAAAAEPVLDEDKDLEAESAPYFVTVVGKKKLRRLHRFGGCGVSSIEVQESEPVWRLRGTAYDLACRHCWKAGDVTLSEAEEADDSGSSSESDNSPAA